MYHPVEAYCCSAHGPDVVCANCIAWTQDLVWTLNRYRSWEIAPSEYDQLGLEKSKAIYKIFVHKINYLTDPLDGTLETWYKFVESILAILNDGTYRSIVNMIVEVWNINLVFEKTGSLFHGIIRLSITMIVKFLYRNIKIKDGMMKESDITLDAPDLSLSHHFDIVFLEFYRKMESSTRHYPVLELFSSAALRHKMMMSIFKLIEIECYTLLRSPGGRDILRSLLHPADMKRYFKVGSKDDYKYYSNLYSDICHKLSLTPDLVYCEDQLESSLT